MVPPCQTSRESGAQGNRTPKRRAIRTRRARTRALSSVISLPIKLLDYPRPGRFTAWHQWLHPRAIRCRAPYRNASRTGVARASSPRRGIGNFFGDGACASHLFHPSAPRIPCPEQSRPKRVAHAAAPPDPAALPGHLTAATSLAPARTDQESSLASPAAEGHADGLEGGAAGRPRPSPRPGRRTRLREPYRNGLRPQPGP